MNIFKRIWAHLNRVPLDPTPAKLADNHDEIVANELSQIQKSDVTE